jgi:hypothetical protein
MPVTVTLTTVPGHKTLEDYGTSQTISIMGSSLGHETLPALANVAEIRTAVARFGARIRFGHPEASFYVSVRLAKGQRKPNGYDVASRRNGLGQENFMHVSDKRTKQDAPAKDAAAAAASTVPEQAGA